MKARSQLRALLFVAVATPPACGHNDSVGADAPPAIDADLTCTIPVASAVESFDWSDTEPNDTPCQASDGGLLSYAAWMGFGANPSAINTDTDVDFYVFRTGDAATLGGLFLEICSDQPNVFDAFVYNVDRNRRQGTLVVDSTNPSTCQTLINGTGADLLAANTEYLLELRAKPGLSLGGNPGLYFA